MDLIWIRFLIAPLLILLPIWLGNRIGIWKKKKNNDEEIASIGPIVGATLGYFAFMLAVTYQMTSTRFQTRKDLLLNDVSELSAANMQIGLLKEPYQTNCKKLIGQYVDFLILLPSENGERLRTDLGRTEKILDLLWLQTKMMSEENAAADAGFAGTVVNLKKQFTRRVVVGIFSGIPTAIIAVLDVIAFFTMFLVGYRFGISGKNSVVATLILAVTFSTVMWLIFALDHPETGFIKLDQQPMIEIQQEIKKGF
jgi:hypothetical protein